VTNSRIGNGRLFPLKGENKEKELARLKDLLENKGQAWATPDKCHNYDGFLQISQHLIDWLQQGFDAQPEDVMRMNWKGFLAKSNSGKFLKIQDSWIKGQPSLKQFSSEGGTQQARPATQAPAAQAAESLVEDAYPSVLPARSSIP